MKVTITHREVRQGTKGDYLHIKYKTDKWKELYKNIWPEFQDKWGLCQVGKEIELKLDAEYNVKDILPAASAPVAIKEEVQAEREIAPQERGMWLKELGARIGDGSLAKDFPNSVINIKAQYYRMMSEATGVDFK